MIDIQQEILQSWTQKRRVKNTQSGWISGNAVCCHHRGHHQDERGRGGMMATNEGGVVFHCFNCHYSTGWQPGRRLGLKMRQLLNWMGMDEDEIRRLSLFALSQIDYSLELSSDEIKELPQYEERTPCPGLPIVEWQGQAAKAHDYLNERGFGNKLDRFYWDDSEELQNRVLIPFTFKNKPMGYTGRLMHEGRPKYFSDIPTHFVYNMDRQLPNAKFCIVVEGIFDAIAIDAVGINSNECSTEQALMIDSLNRECIVVPDRDKPGKQMIKAALDYGWNVAFPDWEDDVKDVADAFKKYGELYTMKSILSTVESSNLKIQLMSKKWIRI